MTVPSQSDLPPGARWLPRTKLPTLFIPDSAAVAVYVAAQVAQLIRDNNALGLPTVLGLPTGSTPVGVYRELVRLRRAEQLDFSRVVTFNLDEYWPMAPQSIHSYHLWMRETFFKHVNIPPGNIHIPRGDLPRDRIDEHCREYEKAIRDAGGIALQLLGVGRTGHVGFNEPGSGRDSLTRFVTLDPVTIRDAAGDFFGEEHVPQHAVTMGVETILSTRRVIAIALGEHKAGVVQAAAEGDQTPDLPVTFLQSHPRVELVADAAAANHLAAVATPWLVEQVDWTPQLEKRAVIWLSQRAQKALLKLDARDFTERHLAELLRERGPVDRLRQGVFDELMATICTQPGGAEPLTILVFSPHPDDDVISMGGTLIALADQGHNVHIAYMTSGNIAVFDHDALRHIDYVAEHLATFGQSTAQVDAMAERLRSAILNRTPGKPEDEDLLAIKGLIRKTEAIAAAQEAGVSEEKLWFLDLPFYRTGQVEKKPIEEEDVAIVAKRLRELNPAQIYVAGDLSDPHGTHRMCADAILQALAVVAEAGVQPEVWLYRGAWQEYEPHEIERAVPLSPEVMLKKKLAIFKHESQKDRALFPGHDEREFWVRAEERTRHTARIYDELGLPEFYALEGFVRYRGQL